jgi:hypothetical protein
MQSQERQPRRKQQPKPNDTYACVAPLHYEHCGDEPLPKHVLHCELAHKPGTHDPSNHQLPAHRVMRVQGQNKA